MSPSPPAVGIDIGGTKMAVAAVDAAGRILARVSLPTEADLGFARAVDRLAGTIDQLAAQVLPAQGRWAGIGIGCAGPVDPVAGLVNNPYTLTGWDRCDIVTPLRRRFGVPVVLENDADAAVLGECWIGAGRGVDSAVMLTFGTGVGGAVILDGRIHRGAGGEHPELGHLAVFPDGPACYCGVSGCLESLASGTAISQAGKEVGLDSSAAVFAAARGGHAGAMAIVERAHRAAAIACWTVFHTLLPRRLILGGGIMDTEFEGFARAMRRQLDPATQFTRSAVDVFRAALGNDAGLVGAARRVLGGERG